MERVDEEFEALFSRYEDPICSYLARMATISAWALGS